MWGVDFMDLDSPKDDEPIIVQDESDEQVYAEKVQPEEPDMCNGYIKYGQKQAKKDKTRARDWKSARNQSRRRCKEMDWELVRIGGLGLKNENALQALESSSTLYK
ncbi:hypothetical protein Tco_1054141 [Tanacetum coccineum]|uniref:Uncharacterized protein n=1 Tax=Tanacetum coccineum TaxID=301880 RepID=A0ABQ5GWZ0_9ASTR